MARGRPDGGSEKAKNGSGAFLGSEKDFRLVPDKVRGSLDAAEYQIGFCVRSCGTGLMTSIEGEL